MMTLKIDGMTCASCAEHVSQALEKVPGVRSAAVSYPKALANVTVWRSQPRHAGCCSNDSGLPRQGC